MLRGLGVVADAHLELLFEAEAGGVQTGGAGLQLSTGALRVEEFHAKLRGVSAPGGRRSVCNV